MLRTIIRLVIAGVVLFGAYKVMSIYALFQFADHMRECLPSSGTCRMVELKASRQEVEVAMGQSLSCARERQSAVESAFLSIPKTEPANSSDSTDYNGLLQMCNDWGNTSQGGKK